ncbi:1-phosphofructokinase [Prauserella muralis]|uniref:1-phosphofructokinase n=1 Tax=Prauserella muralis TaxID=588067 RepID=A0A2V4ARL2_9PSEU|nr:1-phosphofructokinase [Prauserella muralis]PXY23009.1 1-phosphofructokinase [Prauserella muralis]TWE28619.1 1-phosphofructokinase [Prauserella muralis]
MIVTVTLNPSLDRTIEVARLVRGALVRATGTRLDPGGKGVNVARALAAHGIRSCAVVPRSGAVGDELVALLSAEGIDVRAVPVTGQTRSNVSLVEPDGTVTKINEPGGPLTEADLRDVISAVLSAAERADWVVASGSLPPGVPDTVYAELGRRLTGLGVRFAVDTSGAALRAALAAGPALVKPNRDELAEASGSTIETLADAARAAKAMVAAGARTVLASLGADGAVLVDEQGARYGESPVKGGRSSVGAGDAMLAGYLAAGVTGGDALTEALSWGAAAVRLPGSRMPGPADVDRSLVRIQGTPDFSRSLSGQDRVHGMEQIQ